MPKDDLETMLHLMLDHALRVLSEEELARRGEIAHDIYLRMQRLFYKIELTQDEAVLGKLEAELLDVCKELVDNLWV